MKCSSVFRIIDLFQRYWRLYMDKTCNEKAAFIRRYGTFQFKVIPFGLMNSQTTFPMNDGPDTLKGA